MNPEKKLPRFRFFKRGYPKMVSEEDIPKQKRKNTYFCYKCNKWHSLFSNIGHEHRDFKADPKTAYKI